MRLSDSIITPKIIFRFLAGLAILGFLSYLWFEIVAFVGQPNLDLFNPAQDLRTGENSIVIQGKTTSDATFAINGQVVYLDRQGRFEQEINLAPGLNKLDISSTNRLGKTKTITRYILYED